MRGRRPKNALGLGESHGSLIKIPVSHFDTPQPSPQVYEQLVSSLKDKPELTLDDLLAIKDTIPFKNPKWVAKCRSKTKGEKIGKSFKQILGREPDSRVEGSYQSIETAKSIKPPHKYCDFTGFRAKYTDKKTGIRYYSHAFHRDICQLSNTVKDQYLELRNAVVSIK